MPQTLRKILIANRGEVALRIAATCRKMGIIPVSLYAVGEEQLPHVTEIENHYSLGKGSLAETYLNIDAIMSVLAKSGADAVHPGYGFLSENAAFCEAVTQEGYSFIGPSAAVIRQMGDKTQARRCAEAAGVPVVPGYQGEAQDNATLLEAAQQIGFPLLIKAAAGGGGKGMRQVADPALFETALRAAKEEAAHAFGDDRVFLETCLLHPDRKSVV